ncbi:MAG: acyltransferase [Chromatiaceae bacterium]|nr:acyltransferase [Chromatiaceae bacterium]
MSNPSPAVKPPFLRHIHYFRGFVILNIVLVHTWVAPREFSDRDDARLINLIAAIAFHDSTIYFVFISGFLFYYLSHRFDLLRYYKTKLVFVVSPYILMTTLVLLARGGLSGLVTERIELEAFVGDWIYALFHGTAQVQYWYIPFIVPVFLVSPLLLRIPQRAWPTLAVIAALVPLLGTRTGSTLSLGLYLYLFPVYLIGIYAAMDYQAFSTLIKRRLVLLVALAVLSTGVLALFAGRVYLWGPFNLNESLFYVQVLAICFIALVLFQRLEGWKSPLLDAFATYSFSIFFLHLLVELGPVKLLWYELVDQLAPGLMLPLSLLFAIGVAFATLGVCILAKRLLGQYSRWIIGT